jgi:hypothetical protein
MLVGRDSQSREQPDASEIPEMSFTSNNLSAGRCSFVTVHGTEDGDRPIVRLWPVPDLRRCRFLCRYKGCSGRQCALIPSVSIQ